MNLEILRYKIRKRFNRIAHRILNNCNLSFLYKSIETDLLILDDFYPCPLSNFRYIEFNSYLEKYNTFVQTTGNSLPLAHVYKSISHFIRIHPHREKIKIFNKNRKVNAKLAVLVFQHNTEIFLDYLEENKIPFIFTLYPGGNFKLHDEQGDKGLMRIFNSPYFRRVIVTQKVTMHYLLSKKVCKESDIEFIYGCPMEIPTATSVKKFDASTTNICFVAAKYHPTGMDKGYDTFIETARILLKDSDNYRFHVVGGFNEDDIDISDIKSHFKYYGYLNIEKLREFYKEMHIILSPNRSNILANGAFDGFPTAAVIEAGLANTVMILTDDLQQNFFFEDKKDCIFVKNNACEIAEIIEDLSKNGLKSSSMAENGSSKLSLKLNIESQFNPRFQLIESLIY